MNNCIMSCIPHIFQLEDKIVGGKLMYSGMPWCNQFANACVSCMVDCCFVAFREITSTLEVHSVNSIFLLFIFCINMMPCTSRKRLYLQK